MRYVTGDNAPGYLPEGEPRGPWNSWADAVRDLASLIEDDAENRLEDAEALETEDERSAQRERVKAELEGAKTYGIAEHRDPRGPARLRRAVHGPRLLHPPGRARRGMIARLWRLSPTLFWLLILWALW
jgi:hypothetical protein